MRCWIFGLGTSGRLILDLRKQLNLTVEGIIVGNGYKSCSEHKDIPVYEISEIDSDEIKAMALIYTVKMERKLILGELDWKGEVIDYSSTRKYKELLGIYYKTYFAEKQISFDSGEYLELNGCKMLNPFLLREELGVGVEEAFLSEIGDLVLPPLWNDYSRIDEGNYEYGNVNIEEGDVVIDCGANLGVFSAIAAWKGAKVHAFEPMKDVFTYLEKQSEVYPEQIIPVNKALSDTCGNIEMFVGDEEHMTQSTLLENEGFKKEIVECITLDKYVAENKLDKVDFIKADIEGSERMLLMGGKNVLAKYAPKLSICTYHRPDDREVLTEIIKSANPDYKIVYNWKKLYAYVEQK